MKKLILMLNVIMVGSFLMLGCRNEKKEFDLVTAKKAIQERSNIYVDAVNKKDSVGLSHCYTVDAKLMAPNEKSAEGRAAIQKMMGGWMKTGMPHLSIETVEVWGDDNALTAEEIWTFKDKDGKILDQGKAVEVYKKEDGVWKLHRDCFNSDMPMMK
ncbi:nuclear transport factor 2 family protein [Flavobacterium sp. H122]|uniref:YybH family protein n=1 Tax=Flavobacterium sp. H122 TaxID=2529860 RepID=UPI0010AA4212|nr:nuclear transport factor 2 family protein [Flavobacterium sp. H122]